MAIIESLRQHRRILLLPIVAVAIFLWIKSSQTKNQAELHMILGADAQSIRQLDLRFRRTGNDSVVYELTRRFNRDAPANLFHTAPLAQDAYELGARIMFEDGRERQITRSFLLGAKPVEIDLQGNND